MMSEWECEHKYFVRNDFLWDKRYIGATVVSDGNSGATSGTRNTMKSLNAKFDR